MATKKEGEAMGSNGATKGASKICILTGASRGIGLELTRRLLNEGHRVFAGARNPSASKELMELAKGNDRLRALQLDVRSNESVARFAAEIGQSVDHVDMLINNAGVYDDKDDSIAVIEPEVVLETFDINALGPLRLTKAFLPLLKKAKIPRIANITSQMGSISDNSSGGAPAYRMSKAALNMFTHTLAIEEKDIISLCLHPGWVQTRMGGKGAPMSTQASAEGLLLVIENATAADSGKFLNYGGRELPW